jgi:outer membrane protein assembly factor BamD
LSFDKLDKSFFISMRKKITHFLFILSIFFLTACSGYNKLLKNGTYDEKYEAAIKYFNDGAYGKAYPLLEELVTVLRGTSRAEEIYYKYAYCNYHMGDYEFANFHFKTFVKTYPTSVNAQDCFYMSAYTYYLSSPNYSLDQTNTYKAIGEMQAFVNRYPESEKVKEANEIIDKLRFKLETKAYEQSKQYFRTRKYKAAVIYINATLKDYPATKYREELRYIVVKSNYLYAVKSFETKQEERFLNTIESYKTFIEKFPKSKYLKEVEGIYLDSIMQLEKLSS